MPQYSLLPPEIWIVILRWATMSDRDFTTAAYIPFRFIPNDSFDPVIAVKRTLALVCREWNRLATELLYEDLRIFRGTDVLKDTLEQDRGYGRLVRRVVLPYPSTVTELYQPLLSVDVLKLCTNIEALVRPCLVAPEILHFHFDAEKLSFSSLRRLDWWYHSEAERSGGINSLNAVLHNAPNLQYLSVGGLIDYGRIFSENSPLFLPELQTLRLHEMNGLFLRQLVQLWSLPALSCVIVDFLLAELGLEVIWETFGPQLRTVEFGKHTQFLVKDYITACLQNCSNLTELNYYLFFTTAPDTTLCHASVTTIGLHASVNTSLQDGEPVCAHIEKHFDMLTHQRFPALKKILLYGEWRGLISHPRLAPMWQTLKDRSITFAFARRS